MHKRHFHKKQDNIPPKTAYPAGIAFCALFCIAPHPGLWYTYACDLTPGYGDAVVAAHLAADDVLGADDDDDLGLLLELQQHLQLGVRLKAGQHAGGVVIIEQLAAEFQIQFIVKLLDALAVGSVLGAVILSLVKKTQPAEAK